MTSALAALQPTKRFSNRVENYVRYRPSYPPEIISFFEETLGLDPTKHIADIGSGTGLFSEPLLKKGYKIIGVKPNDEMRRAAENHLGKYPGFISSNHRAEQSGLPGKSIDLITVAQAFHWMDPEATKKEFFRILKPGGHIVLAWNLRLKNTPFLLGLQQVKQKYGIGYKNAVQADEDILRKFFDPMEMRSCSFPNIQMLDFDGLKGQMLSMSYSPLPGQPNYEAMIGSMIKLFVQYNQNGFVKMEYETKLYWNAS